VCGRDGHSVAESSAAFAEAGHVRVHTTAADTNLRRSDSETQSKQGFSVSPRL